MARITNMGQVYDGGDVVVTIPGIYDLNPSSIEYGYEYEHTLRYGLKRKPRGWSMGKFSPEGKITLSLDVVAELEKVAPLRDLAQIRPFPISVVYFNAQNETIRDIILAKFKGNKRKVTVDDEISNEFDLFVLNVQPHLS